ncbi:MAG: hypothetical protein QOJ64_2724 [Acidobacteriota bacterium]|jgi:uncharacterized membrane protein HdeD (DUF308 family)|nr:hypothetical protein [Acidobacteriota bacterium]
MAKTICKLLGVVLLLVGIIGFIKPGFAGTHLSMAHNLVHILTGIIALYFGFAASLSAARGFSLAFGAIYLLLGIVGFIMGAPAAPTMANMAEMGVDNRLWSVIPGTLELGTADHAVHILLGIVFLVGALMTKADSYRSAD